jgi:hypothetical protein
MIVKLSVFLLAIVLITSVSTGMLSMSGFVQAKKSGKSGSGGGSGNSGGDSSKDNSKKSGSNNDNGKSSGGNNDNSGDDNDGGSSGSNDNSGNTNSGEAPVAPVVHGPPAQKEGSTDTSTGIGIDENTGLPLGTKSANPDQGCAFNPGSPSCKPDKFGNCPPGFGHNDKGNCFPRGRCPSGVGRHDNDESGKCFPTPIHCPPGFFVKHGICNKDIFINIHNVIHTVSTGSHSISDSCFNTIKISWFGKVQRGQNKEVDQFIDRCLG